MEMVPTSVTSQTLEEVTVERDALLRVTKLICDKFDRLGVYGFMCKDATAVPELLGAIAEAKRIVRW